VVEFINLNFENDVLVWISLGTPKQDLVGYKICQKLESRVFGIGAAVDFIAYPSLEAPTFIRRFGLEWVYRIQTSRRRLWQRYIKVFIFLTFKFLQKSFKLRKN
jgi:N-acetylglucosaminyldiphosphoundecaprenol N-acetyl-beta-D-mannosaminyltransferase